MTAEVPISDAEKKLPPPNWEGAKNVMGYPDTPWKPKVPEFVPNPTSKKYGPPESEPQTLDQNEAAIIK